jgi:hypothetical protein
MQDKQLLVAMLFLIYYGSQPFVKPKKIIIILSPMHKYQGCKGHKVRLPDENEDGEIRAGLLS